MKQAVRPDRRRFASARCRIRPGPRHRPGRSGRARRSPPPLPPPRGCRSAEVRRSHEEGRGQGREERERREEEAPRRKPRKSKPPLLRRPLPTPPPRRKPTLRRHTAPAAPAARRRPTPEEVIRCTQSRKGGASAPPFAFGSVNPLESMSIQCTPPAVKIVVGLSGGVDSAVAALLLKQQGHDVVGLFMKNWEDDDDDEYCSSRQDFDRRRQRGRRASASRSRRQLRRRIQGPRVRRVPARIPGRPHAQPRRAVQRRDQVQGLPRPRDARSAPSRSPPATTRACAKRDGRFELLKGLDPAKDQSYFLHRLNQAQLSQTLFPVGELHKTEVRRIAREIGLPNAKKKDSTGICFIGERPFREFLNRYLPNEPGPDRGRPTAARSASTQGLSRSTRSASARAWASAASRPRARSAARRARAVVRRAQGHRAQHALRWCRATTIRGCCRARWRPTTRAGSRASAPRRGALRAPRRATGRPMRPASWTSARARLSRSTSSTPQWAVTPGQSAVLYDGEVCLGGGVIR